MFPEIILPLVVGDDMFQEESDEENEGDHTRSGRKMSDTEGYVQHNPVPGEETEPDRVLDTEDGSLQQLGGVGFFINPKSKASSSQLRRASDCKTKKGTSHARFTGNLNHESRVVFGHGERSRELLANSVG